MQIRLDEAYRTREAALQLALRKANDMGESITVALRAETLESGHWNTDIADDYLEAVILGELLFPHCDEIKWDLSRQGADGALCFCFTLTPANPEGIAKVIAWMSQSSFLLNDEPVGWIPDYADPSEYENLRWTFADELATRVHRFFDLAESYVRNLIPGLAQVLSGEELQESYEDLRERYSRWWDSTLEEQG